MSEPEMLDKLIMTFFGSIAVGIIICLAGAGLGIPVLVVTGAGLSIIAALAYFITIIIDEWR